MKKILLFLLTLMLCLTLVTATAKTLLTESWSAPDNTLIQGYNGWGCSVGKANTKIVSNQGNIYLDNTGGYGDDCEKNFTTYNLAVAGDYINLTAFYAGVSGVNNLRYILCADANYFCGDSPAGNPYYDGYTFFQQGGNIYLLKQIGTSEIVIANLAYTMPTGVQVSLVIVKGSTNNTIYGYVNGTLKLQVNDSYYGGFMTAGLGPEGNPSTKTFGKVTVEATQQVLAETVATQVIGSGYPLNFTSDGGQLCGYNSSNVNILCGPTNDTTPCYKFTVNQAGYCKLTDRAENYTTAGTRGVPDLSTTGTTSQQGCWFPPFGTNGTKTIYITCKDYADTNQSNEAAANWPPTNVFNITINANYNPPTGQGQVQGYCMQYLNVTWYNGTHINDSLVVLCNNPNGNVDFSSVTITAPSGYLPVSQTISVNHNSSNAALFQNTTLRGISDGQLFNVLGATVTGNISQLLNNISKFVPIDPPYAFTKNGGIIDCSQNFEILEPVTYLNDVFLTGTGSWSLKAATTIKGINFVQGCGVNFAPGYINFKKS